MSNAVRRSFGLCNRNNHFPANFGTEPLVAVSDDMHEQCVEVRGITFMYRLAYWSI